MKNRIQKLMRTLPVVMISLLLFSCHDVQPDSLFDENREPLPPAVLSNLLPAEQLQGFETVTIQGEGFTTNLSRLFVYFNDVRATIISATENEIVVRTPNINGEFDVRVMMLGVEAFSNSLPYRILPLFRPAISINTTNETPFAATRDNDGNIFVSMLASLSPAGIIKFDSDGERVEPVPFGAVQAWFYNSATVGPDGAVYLIRGGLVPILYRLDPAGGTVTSFRTGLGRTEDVTFDPTGAAWTAGTNEGNATNARLNRITNNGATLDRYPFEGQIYALVYHDGHIYLTGTRAGVSYIWRVPLGAGNEPGAEEQVANLTNLGFVGRPTSIAISGDGTIFVGSNGNIALFEYRTDGSLHTLYDGILEGNILKMEYVPGTNELLYTSVPPSGSPFSQQVYFLNVQRPAP